MSQAADGLPTTPESWLAWGSQILQTQAFSVLLGAKLTELDRGCCELSLPIGAASPQFNENFTEHHDLSQHP